MFDINGWEFIIIAVLGALLLGPERLPHYAARVRSGVRELRRLAEGAKDSLREQMGPEFDDIDWKAYDPRQYDPRRIVREALLEDAAEGPAVRDAEEGGRTGSTAFVPPPPPVGAVYDPGRPTPYDADAT